MTRKRNFIHLFCLLFIVLFSDIVFSQDTLILNNAKATVKLLCSETMHGRGYQKKGHKIAAKFIRARFKEIGLSKINNTHVQHFPMHINVIDKSSVQVGKSVLKAGIDFIVHEKSGTANATCSKEKVCYLPSSYKGLIESVIDSLTAKNNFPALIILGRKKLTASVSETCLGVPIIEMIDTVYEKTSDNDVTFSIQTNLKSITSQNVLGAVKGNEFPDSCIIISAHYDHLGEYSNALFAGANDNASGIATMLSLAEYFIKHPQKYSVVFIAFGGEEVGLIGSKYYVMSEPLVPLKSTKFILNLDLMGNGVEGISVVGGTVFPKELKVLEELNVEEKAVPIVKSRGNVPNSDHYYFLNNGVKGFFIYTLGGPTHYHDTLDTAEHLQFSKFIEIRKLLIRFVESLNR